MSTATTSQDRPLFRQDLVAEAIEDNGARYIDVIDPDTGGEFRFFEAEYAVACAMDGERDVAGLVRWAQEELGITPTAAELKNVISTLGGLGYLGARDSIATLPAIPTPIDVAIAPVVEAKPPAKEVDSIKVPTVRLVDDDLAPGIIAGAKPTPAPISMGDFELGQPGAIMSTAAESMPASDFELGNSGATAKKTPPLPKTQGVALGPAGATDEPSLDLMDHVAVKPADVKEAVRASQIMQAVAPPDDDIAIVATPAKVETKVEAKPQPKVEAKPEPKVEAKPEPKVEAKPEPKVEAKPAKADVKPKKTDTKVEKADAKPEPVKETKADAKPAKETKADSKGKSPIVDKAKKSETAKAAAAAVVPSKVAAPEPAKKGTSGALIALLVLCVLAAGAYFAWKYWINVPDTNVGSPAASKPAEVKPPVAPPAPPPPPTAKLAIESLPAVGLKPNAAGVVETTTTDGTEVKAGDIVIRLNGFQALATQVVAMEKEVNESVPAEIAALEKLRDEAKTDAERAVQEAKAADRRTRLAQKDAQLKAKQADLAKFLVTATANGKITGAAAKGTKVAATDDVAKLEANALTATFIVPKGASYSAGSKAIFNITVGGTGSQEKVECDVVSFDAATSSLKVMCPATGAAVAGAEMSM
jgi:hypothetical protein